MKLIKVAAGVLNQTPLDWKGNKQNILDAIAEARDQGATILCLPELCITGYGCEDAFHSPSVIRIAGEVLAEILPHTSDMIVSLGLPVLHGGSLFNTACLVADGELLGFVGKQNLAGEGIHYEPRWFKRWPDDARDVVTVAGGDYPIGDLIFRVGGVLIGFEICEDAWVARRPGGELASRGVDIILNPSASHFAFGKYDVRHRFVLEGSRAFHVSYVYSNLVGNEAGRAIYDGDAMIASAGELIARGPRFTFENQRITTAAIDIDSTRLSRSRSGSFDPLILSDSPDVIEAKFAFPEIDPTADDASKAPWEISEHIKEEEFSHAVALALFDYMRKSRSHGLVISLSGGADSAACAALAWLMCAFAKSSIGLAGMQQKLGYVPESTDLNSVTDWAGRLITTCYQATRNSSDVTRNAAAAVAEAVGARHLVFDVDEIVSNYTNMVAGGIGRELRWKTDDIALQNIQARARAPGVWMLANLFNSLLLSTSNRSEAAVGYATMDGDTCGGLSPIAGIDKAFLRTWLNWLETDGPQGIGPLPALRAVNVQQPTAELRPLETGQTDEGDLMPYDLLDAIEQAAIRDKLDPLECFRRLSPRFPQYAAAQLGVWVERFFKLWCRNQWKRERYAPSFHLDDKNLDPKTWCRFPILSGNFERELNVLREYLANSVDSAANE